MGGEAAKNKMPLAFAKLPQQNNFEVIKQLIRFIARIDHVQNVPKDLLWHVGKSIGVFELLRFDTSHSELRLDEDTA
jgi:hypothetical protein